MMTGLQVLLHLWKEWGIQALVVLSFALQVILLILAEVRRRIDSGVLRAAVWSAYLMADSTAIYALGHLSVTSRSPEHQLMAFWAPFLLLHLGGQDNITAYAIEDNRLWLRHLQLLGVQVAAAAYVLYESSIVGSEVLLWRAAILMFVVGVLKYGERVWALKCSNADLSIENYGEDQNFENSYEYMDMGLQDTEDLLKKAHFMLAVANRRFERPAKECYYYWDDSPEVCESLFTLVEMQMSLMHDVFYSKAEVLHTWYGICIRIISSASTAAAFVLFHRSGQSDQRHGYSRADVGVTYVLLVGALVLEATSLLRAVSSSWALANLEFLRPLVSPLRRLALPERRRWWSDSVGQHNLFELYDRRKNSRSSRIARWLRVEDWWNTMVHSRRIRVSPMMKGMLLQVVVVINTAEGQIPEEAREEHEMYQAVARLMLSENIVACHIATEVYLRWYKDQERAKDQKEAKDEEQQDDQPEDRIQNQELPEDQAEDEDQPEDQPPADRAEEQQMLVEAVEALSNYMLFLLAARPYMLPRDTSRADYSVLCSELGVTSDISTEDFVRSLQAYGSGLNKGISHDQLVDKLDLPVPPCDSHTLRRGSQLGAKLIGEGLAGTPAEDRVNQIAQELGVSADHSQELDFQEVRPADRLKLISFAWVKMLVDVGHSGKAYHHRKQLSNGGELLTVAGLLISYFKDLAEIDRQAQSGWQPEDV